MFFFHKKTGDSNVMPRKVFRQAYQENDTVFQDGWCVHNNGVPLNGDEVERLVSVLPSERQLNFQKTEFMMFVHFGINTFYDQEWGNGTEDPARFNPTDLNTDQWCEAAKSAGAKGIILTCKHHDGFCLFQTKYTEHSVKNSPWQNGKGDVLALLAESCRKYDLKLGVYLSPWDRNSKVYATKAYDDYFVNQLTELLNNYGEIFEVWFDGAKGKDAPDFEYDWKRYYDTIRSLQPQAVISVVGPDVRWCGNEAGKCRKSEWNVVSGYLRDAEKIAEESQQGENDTDKLLKVSSTEEDLGSRAVLKNVPKLIWYPAEVDVSIRKGWFYHKKQDKTVKSLDKLMHIYYSSVGGNASLLLNVCPDKRGRFADMDVMRLKEMGNEIQNAFANSVVEIDEAISFQNKPYFDLDFKSANIRKIVLKEDLTKSQRVEAFSLYLKQEDGYHKVYEGTTIGSKKIILLPEYSSGAVSGVRVHVKQCRSNPELNFIGVYL